jgi:DNA-binding CsgD family transcriptional regulator
VKVEPIIDAIQRAKNMSDLSALLREWRDDSGLSHLVYHAVDVPVSDQPNPVLLLTYDQAWVKRYFEQDYFRLDPVVLAGSKGFLPIDWMNVDHTSATAKHFFAEAESYGVGRHGFTLPIRGPHGERALFTITSNDTDEQWHRRRFAHLADFHQAALYLHDRAMQLAGLRPESLTQSLTRRERQCLKGLVSGLVPQQISAKLNISPSAVHLYLRTARRKLGCSTIAQLIAKAIRLDLIDRGDFN